MKILDTMWIVLACALFAGLARAQAPPVLHVWGSLGSGPGQLNFPYSLGLDDQANVYVCDTYNGRMEKFANDGTFLFAWGAWEPGTDGLAIRTGSLSTSQATSTSLTTASRRTGLRSLRPTVRIFRSGAPLAPEPAN